MGLTADRLNAGLDRIAAASPPFAAALARAGYPPPRIRDRGVETLMRAIVGQQVSVKAADSIWARLEAATGGFHDLRAVLAVPVEVLRGAGLSGQKASYVHALAHACVHDGLDFTALPDDDEAAIAVSRFRDAEAALRQCARRRSSTASLSKKPSAFCRAARA